ncbi:MAG: hypothetical protein MUC47_11385 [Candidatus Kapabacteria bacterium]|nr:hypothetical protein [Candidatus Kapabacteria bacterium]
MNTWCYVFLLMCSSAISLSAQQGGFVRAPGTAYAKIGLSQLSTTSIYDAAATKSMIDEYRLVTVSAYGEVGITRGIMAIVDATFARIQSWKGAEAPSGIGDVSVGVRYALADSAWPISIGMMLDVPTGDASAVAVRDGLRIPMPLGDGEATLWLGGGISRSFWPIKAFASADVMVGLRGVAVGNHASAFNNGEFTHQVRASLKAGYQVLPTMWLTAAIYTQQNVGSVDPTSFSAWGMGNGVAYTAWDVSAITSLGSVDVSIGLSTAFAAPQSIYGGLNILSGIAWRLE